MHKIGLISLLVLLLTACNSTQVAQVSTTGNETKIKSTAKAEVETTINKVDANIEVETSKDIEPENEMQTEVESESTAVGKWANYSQDVRAIIEKYEGKDYQTCRKITYDELNKLHSVGLYMYTNNVTSTRGADNITTKSGGSTDFVTQSEFEKVIAKSYQETNGLLTDIAFGGDSEAIKIVTKILEGKWEASENDREATARQYVKVNTDSSNPAKVINSLGNGVYVERFGLIVPSEENAVYFESLRGQDKTIYKYAEWMVFKQNNEGKITLVKDQIPRAKYKENTFEDSGEGNVGNLLWVSRTPDEERVTFWGKPQFAHVHKTFPEFYDKCGGTDMAFMQWGAYPMAYEYDYTYYKIIEGTFKKENNLLSLMDRENW